jgi:type II secretory pathway pseudopilin PulG
MEMLMAQMMGKKDEKEKKGIKGTGIHGWHIAAITVGIVILSIVAAIWWGSAAQKMKRKREEMRQQRSQAQGMIRSRSSGLNGQTGRTSGGFFSRFTRNPGPVGDPNVTSTMTSEQTVTAPTVNGGVSTTITSSESTADPVKSSTGSTVRGDQIYPGILINKAEKRIYMSNAVDAKKLPFNIKSKLNRLVRNDFKIVKY